MALAIGISISVNSWNQLIYFYSFSSERDPAAIKAVFDFSHLEGRALEMASRDPLMANAKITVAQDDVEVSLGHFVTKDLSGKPEFACRIFDRVEMTFLASDQAVGGAPSQMIVEAPCKMGKDVNRISEVSIPMAKIMSQKPGDKELQFLDGKNLFVSFENIGAQWPQKWYLENVRLKDTSHPGHQVQVSRKNIPETKLHPVSFYWRSQRVPSSKR